LGCFQRGVLGKYYPEDVRARKVVEFFELDQRDIIVAEYVAKLGC
jgi:hypothetical protein